MKKRLRIVQGGARAGKSIAILLILIDIAQTQEGKIISVISETMPHLRRGVERDFLDIMQSHNYYEDAKWDRTNHIYKFNNGTIIEFFSADSSDKVRGPARNIMFINECNNISYETYRQLAIRTSEYIYLDFNPVSEFWVHEELIPKQDHDFEIITYLDNEFLPEPIKQEIESRKESKFFWQVYGLGLIGETEGKIYKDWAIIDEIPHEARLERYGLDFGYSNDPAAIVAIYYYNGGYILDEKLYQRGLFNKQLADQFMNLDKALVMADSAEPKAVDEIKSYGIQVMPCIKGADSIKQGIGYVQSQRISMTKNSINLIKEYRNYMWKTDKDGKILDVPEGGLDHLLDAARYGFESLRPTQEIILPTYTPTFSKCGY